jgi:hypothetical protein
MMKTLSPLNYQALGMSNDLTSPRGKSFREFMNKTGVSFNTLKHAKDNLLTARPATCNNRFQTFSGSNFPQRLESSPT